MNTILEQFKDKINGTFAFFDRMIIKGHIRQFFSASGKGFFLSEQNVLLKDFSAYANQVTSDIVAHVEKMAEETHRPLRYLTSAKIPKEQTAMEILKDDPVEEGLVCILSVVEYCQTLQPIKNKDGKLELRNVDRKCKYYYLYYLDKHFGFMHVKLQTWFPFLIQIYINGREMMKHVFDENGIAYKMYDNSFYEISNIAKAQELADKFDSKSLCRQLDLFAHKVNPYLDTIEKTFHQGYYWCVDQCEFATDVMFKSREALEDIYPSLVGHAFYDFRCTDVFSFLGRKLDPKFQGEAVSDYRKRPAGWRIKFKMKSNSIKMYDKFSCLRVEMTINDPREFKVYKDVHHQDGTVSKRWVPMGKSISNLYRYAEVSKAANRRFLDSLQGIVPAGSIEREINEVCGKRTVRGKTVTGYNVWSKETMQLFETISDGKYLIRGFTNKDIRSILYPQSQSDKKVRGKMSRTLSKLRAHGLIRKIPHSRKYLVTDKGRRVMGALIETKRKIYPDLAAS
ncbi:hypothetical protein C817_05938 [Dorea sp. 5-2]|nr:hypothetical protein C817_05938 [Dorea sp. 5-2]MCX4345558.1 hypothetical protein [Kineothrix sp.]